MNDSFWSQISQLATMMKPYCGALDKLQTDKARLFDVALSFEYFIKLTGGKVFSLCSKDFGQHLAEIGEEIATTVTHSRIPLKTRPIPSTLVVTYKGDKLRGGPIDRDGAWFYDFDQNAIAFYNLDFAHDEEEIEIHYEVNK